MSYSLGKNINRKTHQATSKISQNNFKAVKYSKGCHIILVSFKVCYIEIDLLFESTDFCGGRETKQLLNEKRVDTKE